MDASVFLSLAKKALGDRPWSADLVLHVGAELAQSVNSLKNLSGSDKSELVCQTILKMLDDGEKAEKERDAGSTGTAMTKVPWDDCRSVVKNLLPAALQLVVKASRGGFSLEKVVEQVPLLDKVRSCLSPFLPFLTQIQSFVLAAREQFSRLWAKKASLTDSLAQIQEMRELVLRVEAMVKEAHALRANLPLPNPEPSVVLLPGELPIPLEVSDAQ
jgi:hypothetical protein